MNTNRRNFLLTVGVCCNSPIASWAATTPVEGKNFTKLRQAIPVAVPEKIEVIEFFGYWCPHCFHFEPMLDAWSRKLPSNVNFRRIPVAWQSSQEMLQRLYLALELMPAKLGIHLKVFEAIHVQHLRMDTEAGVKTFATANGLDAAKLNDLMKGFSVSTKLKSINQALASYNIEGVPTMAVNGQFLTSPEQAGGEESALQVVDGLIKMASQKH